MSGQKESIKAELLASHRGIYTVKIKGLLCHQQIYKTGISPQADGKLHAVGHESIRLVKIKSLNPSNQLPIREIYLRHKIG